MLIVVAVVLVAGIGFLATRTVSAYDYLFGNTAILAPTVVPKPAPAKKIVVGSDSKGLQTAQTSTASTRAGTESRAKGKVHRPLKPVALAKSPQAEQQPDSAAPPPERPAIGIYAPNVTLKDVSTSGASGAGFYVDKSVTSQNATPSPAGDIVSVDDLSNCPSGYMRIGDASASNVGRAGFSFPKGAHVCLVRAKADHVGTNGFEIRDDPPSAR